MKSAGKGQIRGRPHPLRRRRSYYSGFASPATRVFVQKRRACHDDVMPRRYARLIKFWARADPSQDPVAARHPRARSRTGAFHDSRRLVVPILRDASSLARARPGLAPGPYGRGEGAIRPRFIGEPLRGSVQPPLSARTRCRFAGQRPGRTELRSSAESGSAAGQVEGSRAGVVRWGRGLAVRGASWRCRGPLARTARV